VPPERAICIPGASARRIPRPTAANDNYSFAVDPATSFFDRTGYLYITLAPDADQDSDHFGTVAAAYASIMPAYRVGVSTLGNVEVFPVHVTLTPGTVLDTSIASWNTPANTTTYYQQNELTNADGSPRGTPITDRLTTTMLTTPQCWSNP